ncbi:MAG: hypothetical protein QM692_21260 [Thermomicrobiales bacterium]
MDDEEARAALWRRQRANRRANNARLATKLIPTPDAARETHQNWAPIEQGVKTSFPPDPPDYDSDRMPMAAGEER